ncbi:MAG: hypothetical protein EAZ84_00870 [Verrucomicrobia bacterium]|nr:MAG: hypothetical protein EAZ84_00870 [Verrucomicrobiota bacterium]
MSNRRQSTFEVAQMGAVWIASISLFGISAIGATETAAIEGVLEALKTHSVANPTPSSASSTGCEVCH